MEDANQVDTVVNGIQVKQRELIIEASYKPDGATNGDLVKHEMNANGGSTESNASVDLASLPQKGSGGNGKPRGPTRAQKMNKLYSLPTPLRTFPLPNFVPHNPISLVQILYTWIRQTINPPSSHPHAMYQGVFSPELRSIHVTDETSIRALWQDGFFGKGSLSRSEPSWLDREKRRIGANASKTSEEVTRQRRAERQQAKWERARIGREAIDQKLREERGMVLDAAQQSDKSQSPMKSFLPPVGPEELLRLPNSQYELDRNSGCACPDTTKPRSEIVGLRDQPQEQMKIPTAKSTPDVHASSTGYQPPHVNEVDLLLRPLHKPVATTISEPDCDGSINGNTVTGGTPKQPAQLTRKKSVRFSPTIEQTTFLPSDPISSDFSKPSPPPSTENNGKTQNTEEEETLTQIHNQEHIQLTMEEAFFLSYSLGVLSILDADSHEPIPRQDLLPLFRNTSYFPTSIPSSNSPDDPFLLSYIVYHHFRSLGWCVRGGTKFGVDYLLYNRGPVFSHAEFAVLILPSYSHSYWSSDAAIAEEVRKKQSKKWSWLHCVNRVNGQVKKTVVLAYVDVPPPVEEGGMRVDEVLSRYRVREVVLKRWLSNRSRD